MAIFKEVVRGDGSGIAEYYRVLNGNVYNVSYDVVTNKPSINGIELIGDISVTDLVRNEGFVQQESDPTVPEHIKLITEGDIIKWQASVDADYVTSAIGKAISNISQFSLEPVDVLPTENIKTNVIYAVPSENTQLKNARDEYVYINGDWECIGSTAIDLSGYAKKSEAIEMIMFSTRDTKEERKAKFLHAIELFKANKPFDARFYCPYGVAVLGSTYSPTYSHTAFLFDMDFERKGLAYSYVLTFILEQSSQANSGIGYAEIQLMSSTDNEDCEYLESFSANTTDTNYYLPRKKEIVTKEDIQNPFFITSSTISSSMINKITETARSSQWESLTFILSGESVAGNHGVYKYYSTERKGNAITGYTYIYKYQSMAPTGTDTITTNGLTQTVLNYSVITLETDRSQTITNYSITQIHGDSTGYYLDPVATEPFQPNTDNAPTNKKYVDDAISNAVSEASQVFVNYYTKEEIDDNYYSKDVIDAIYEEIMSNMGGSSGAHLFSTLEEMEASLGGE